MNQNICNLLIQFTDDPDLGRSRLETHRDEFLEHLEECDKCCSFLDEMGDDTASLIFGALSGEESLLTSEEIQQIERQISADVAHEEEVRRAVRETLLPSLGWGSRRVANKFDPLTLYAAIEAVSTLIRRHLRLEQPGANIIQLNHDGSVAIQFSEGISANEMRLEIARFTNLWESEVASLETKVQPSVKAAELAEWVYSAAYSQPRLLRHFRSLPESSVAFAGQQQNRWWQMWPIAGPTCPLMLVPVRYNDRINDLFERWKPVLQDPKVYAVLEGSEGNESEGTPVPIYTIESSVWGIVRDTYFSSSNRQIGKAAFPMQYSVFLADGQLFSHSSRFQPIVQKASKTGMSVFERIDNNLHTDTFLLLDESECTLTRVGTVRHLEFTSTGMVQFIDASGSLIRARAELIDFPLPLKNRLG